MNLGGIYIDLGALNQAIANYAFAMALDHAPPILYYNTSSVVDDDDDEDGSEDSGSDAGSISGNDDEHDDDASESGSDAGSVSGGESHDGSGDESDDGSGDVSDDEETKTVTTTSSKQKVSSARNDKELRKTARAIANTIKHMHIAFGNKDHIQTI